MSLHEYLCSQTISSHDPPWHALLFSLMRKADTTNSAKLKAAWPEQWEELQRRHNAPGGVLPEDDLDPAAVACVRVDISGKVRRGD